MAGGAGTVVLHTAGEVAAVEDRAHVEVAVGDFFTAAVLSGIDHGEGGDAGRCLGCLIALLVVLLSVLRVLGIFRGNLGGDALLVQATGQTGGQHTVAGNAAAVAGCGDVLGVGALHATGAAVIAAVLVFTLVRAVIGVVGAADGGYTGSHSGMPAHHSPPPLRRSGRSPARRSGRSRIHPRGEYRWMRSPQQKHSPQHLRR